MKLDLPFLSTMLMTGSARQSELSSLAAQRSTGHLHAIESPVLTPQTLPGSLPLPVLQSDTGKHKAPSEMVMPTISIKDLGCSDPVHKPERALKNFVDLFSRLTRKLRGTFAHVHPVSIIVFA